MRASHIVVAILGLVVSFVMLVFFRSVADGVGADASDAPYASLWVYTPYASPGDRLAAKIFLQGGDGVSASKVSATIDGAPVTLDEPVMNPRRPSRQFEMGKLDIELAVPLPPGLAPGEHVLAFDLLTSCDGSSFSRACGNVHLETPIDAGSTPMRLWAIVRALLAAVVVWLAIRFGRRPVWAWVNAAGKGGGALGSAFIPLFVLWGAASYWPFARWLAAGVGTSSDVFFGVAMVAWLALPPVALVWKRKVVDDRSPSIGTIRFVPEPPRAGSEQRAYRDAAVAEPTSRKWTLDDVARILWSTFKARLRRSRNRLVPAWIWGVPVTFTAADPDDLTRGVVHVRGHYGYIVTFVAKLADEVGPLELELDGETTRVERGASAAHISESLRAPSPRTSAT